MAANTIDQKNHSSNFNDDDDIESLSLRDLPTTATPAAVDHHYSRRSSASDPTSDFFFEFLINSDDDLITSTADDVIFHGRLLPYAPPPPRRSLSLSSVAARLTRTQFAESSSELESLPAIRPSRSLNCRKLHRSSSHHRYHHSKRKVANRKDDVFHRKLVRNNNDYCNADRVPVKLPWYWLVFGLPVKIAAEMELKDIKSRQYRREFALPAARGFSGNRRCSSGSWKFLNVLSCKSHSTVDVNNTAPLHSFLM